jgi:hypothetical protein
MRTVALLVVAAAVGAAGPSSRVVRPSGQIGPFRIDVTTERQLRAAVGKPDRVDIADPGGGRMLVYRCGRGCTTVYSISDSTGKLSDFETSSRRFVTSHGSRVGMPAAEAARRERRKLLPGCGNALYLHLRWDAHHAFVLTVWRGKVDEIIFLGPHSVYYDGLC